MGGDVCVVGSIVKDLSFYTDRLPEPGETREGRFLPGLGGKGFNQAVAARKMECSTSFIGAVGAGDDESRAFIERFDELGVEYSLERIPQAFTGAASIVIDDEGRNEIIVALGANKLLSRERIHSSRRLLVEARVVLVQFETNSSAVVEALRLAKEVERSVTAICNPAPAGEGELDPALFALVDILTPNETELGAIAGVGSLAGASLEEIDAACRRIPIVPEMLVTLGERGAYHFLRGRQRADPLGLVPALEVTAVDTSGAGDAFNGAFAAGLVRFSGERKRAIRLATVAAGRSVTKRGTSASIPSFDEIEGEI